MKSAAPIRSYLDGRSPTNLRSIEGRTSPPLDWDEQRTLLLECQHRPETLMMSLAAIRSIPRVWFLTSCQPMILLRAFRIILPACRGFGRRRKRGTHRAESGENSLGDSEASGRRVAKPRECTGLSPKPPHVGECAKTGWQREGDCSPTFSGPVRSCPRAWCS